ncbi:peptidase S8/S53 domain-containing protein [Phascolomyces articulosus]|uniref:Peptidase S8/S53 domain-containing protein n=1 Tax=Phascolomyces articulosus TaxID=60185 RepID=A0AAD5PG58_9FUNG|nr:peptidase S8/S53 domain-containing protein [Phascolomyces articulosus]
MLFDYYVRNKKNGGVKTSRFIPSTLLLLYILGSTATVANAIIDHPKWAAAAALGSNTHNALSGRYIIEFDENYEGTSTRFVKELEHEHDHIKWKVAHDYDTESIFRGISVQLEQDGFLAAADMDEDNENKLLSEHQVIHRVMEKHHVKRVYPVIEIQRPTIDLYSSIDPEALNLSPDVKDLPFAHSMTQVERVHRELGFWGDGITVGVIDTGVDYYHPALGGGFGPGYKVAIGYDLVGDTFNVSDPSSIHPQDTPLDSCQQPSRHGTHVSGIIAADDKKYNFTGVAPHVTLGMWRIFGCTGSTSNDLVIKAMIMAYEEGCNVINLSLGGVNSWPEDPSAVVADRIAKKNVTMVIAAGNEGAKGAFMISSPSTGYDVISVASVDNEYSLQPMFFVDSTGDQFPYTLSSTTNNFVNSTLVAYSNNSDDNDDDACPGTKPDNDLTGHIVLVKRGSCEFDLKASQIADAGGIAMLVYDKDGADVFKPTTEVASIPVAAVSHTSGIELLKQLQEGPLSLSFSNQLYPVKISSAGLVSRFSSVGPTYEFGMKPDIAGVGGFIFSTLPQRQGSYGILSGTSMASPYVAGVCALYLQAHGPAKDPLFVREQLQNYAAEVPAPGNREIIPLDSPIRQGGGLVQAYDAIQGGIHITPGKISFNDTVRYKPQTVTITNMKDRTVTLALENVPGVPVEPYNLPISGFAPVEPAPSNSDLKAYLSFESSITLKAGDGTVQFPYMGVIGNVTEIPIFDRGFPLITSMKEISSHSGDNTEESVNVTEYVINRTPGVGNENGDGGETSVLVLIRFLMGTRTFLADVLNSEQITIGTAVTSNYVQRNTLNGVGMVVIDSWNGTYIPNKFEHESRQVPVENGTYFLRWRALRLMGDPDNPDSWETVTSKPIIVK